MLSVGLRDCKEVELGRDPRMACPEWELGGPEKEAEVVAKAQVGTACSPGYSFSTRTAGDCQ